MYIPPDAVIFYFLTAFTEKIGNVPFASLIATLVIFSGVGVFCGTLYRALSIILKSVMEDLFQFKVPWYVYSDIPCR